MSVGFSFVGINANLPQSIINMFTVLDIISATQMIDIYLTLINNYPEYQDVLSYVLPPYLDFVVKELFQNRKKPNNSTIESDLLGF